MGEYVKAGFGLGVGSILATLIFVAVGLALFIWGYMMWKGESRKPRAAQNRGRAVAGLVLMGIGCLLGLGMGLSVLVGAIGTDMGSD